MSGFALEAPTADGPPGPSTEASWPQVLAEMMEVLRASHRALGCEDARAIELAEAGVMALGQHMGGRPYYLPKGDRLQSAARNRRIFLEWRGNNEDEIMQRFEIGSLRRLQQIIAEQSAIHLRRVQPDLFRRGGD